MADSVFPSAQLDWALEAVVRIIQMPHHLAVQQLEEV
jgi:hypothetical protein